MTSLAQLRVRLRDSLDLHNSEATGLMAALQPVIVLDDLTFLPGSDAGPGSRPCIGSYEQAAVAAEFPHVWLWNPVGSGVIARVDQLLVKTTALVHTIVENYLVSGTAATVTYRFGDSRMSGRPACTPQRGSAGAKLSDEQIWDLINQANDFFVVYPNYVLGEGAGIGVRVAATNNNLYCGFRWTEQQVSA
jgi:hypothetical protein